MIKRYHYLRQNILSLKLTGMQKRQVNMLPREVSALQDIEKHFSADPMLGVTPANAGHPEWLDVPECFRGVNP